MYRDSTYRGGIDDQPRGFQVLSIWRPTMWGGGGKKRKEGDETRLSLHIHIFSISRWDVFYKYIDRGVYIYISIYIYMDIGMNRKYIDKYICKRG